jgi:class 3 adenylate cyclase
MGIDEVGTLRALTTYREIIDALIAQDRGRIFNTADDSVVAEFSSVVDAVQCAVEVQRVLGAENDKRSLDKQMHFRIGVHVGDVLVQGDNLFGDGVNIAARLETLAEPGGFACPLLSVTMSGPSSPWCSRTAVSKSSRTSLSQCGHIGSAHQHRSVPLSDRRYPARPTSTARSF